MVVARVQQWSGGAGYIYIYIYAVVVAVLIAVLEVIRVVLNSYCQVAVLSCINSTECK